MIVAIEVQQFFFTINNSVSYCILCIFIFLDQVKIEMLLIHTVIHCSFCINN